MTSHMLVTRIRQIAEHAAVPDQFNIDVRFNTRTIYISPLERLLIAPHQISFHLEHHLMASVPIYNLRRLHELLLNKGFYKGVTFSRGYLNLLRQRAITNPHS
jgi:fatty acid desaturase|tara:strand:+ start:135 stop:443 length:309 start_codon:yes stop_codon:yes gene_type:complete